MKATTNTAAAMTWSVPRANRPRLKLLIAIPALNEEDNIERIIQRALKSRQVIIDGSPVTDVEVTVVSDGSTDRTVELARRYLDHINLIVFETNRGYGAAIKAAWAASDAELLAFLDADGTCDPDLFASFCRTIEDESADIVLGSRLNPDSQMPLVRRVGNRVFAGILMAFSSSVVKDTASGMRVVRRTVLPRLFPLPDGLHFTPAMSARAVLSGGATIVEVPMPYHERVGESKLRIGADGWRFLRAIVDAAFLFRPSRPLAVLGIASIAVAAGLMVGPTIYYIGHKSVLEWMIYRFIVSDLLAVSGGLLLSSSYLAARVVHLTLGIRRGGSWHGAVQRFLGSRLMWLVIIVLVLGGGLLVLPSFLQLVRTGVTYEHWSRFIAMSLCVEIALILVVTRLVDYSLGLIAIQMNAPDRQRP